MGETSTEPKRNVLISSFLELFLSRYNLNKKRINNTLQYICSITIFSHLTSQFYSVSVLLLQVESF